MVWKLSVVDGQLVRPQHLVYFIFENSALGIYTQKDLVLLNGETYTAYTGIYGKEWLRILYLAVYSKHTILTIFVLLGLMGAFIIPFSARGQSGSNSSNSFWVPFGGTILTKVPCTCTSFGFSKFKLRIGLDTTWIVVGPPNPGSFLLNPLTSQYDRGNISIGSKVLGLALPVELPCLVGKIPACLPVGAGFPVKMIGTN